MIILPMYILSARDVLILYVCRGRNCALVASGAWNITGSWVWSIHPLLQLIHGWKAANQGYPRIALFPLGWRGRSEVWNAECQFVLGGQ
jgi:hypothetical protein